MQSATPFSDSCSYDTLTLAGGWFSSDHPTSKSRNASHKTLNQTSIFLLSFLSFLPITSSISCDFIMSTSPLKKTNGMANAETESVNSDEAQLVR
jgi:hypothetical protein